MNTTAFTLIQRQVIITTFAVPMGILVLSLKRPCEQSPSLHCPSNIGTYGFTRFPVRYGQA